MQPAPPAGQPDLRYVATPASDTAGQNQSLKDIFPTKHYPEIEPNASGLLEVGDGHQVYWEECGQQKTAENPNPPAALYIHGGPGGGCSPNSRRFFDPSYYRIVCHDQRGCGRSLPNASEDWAASIKENNTTKLISDLEKLREFLGISKWSCILGGSWGSTLAIAYAEAHPDSIEDIVLRGVFLFGLDEVNYLFRNGLTSGQNPEAWEKYVQFLKDTREEGAEGETDYLAAYYKRLSGTDEMRSAAASAFVGYELAISKTFVTPQSVGDTLARPTKLIPFALFEVVYMINVGFLEQGQLLANAGKLKNHRVSIIHGRADYVCQPKAAYQLYKELQKVGNNDAYLEFVAGAGHSDGEPGIIDALVRATDKYKTKRQA